MQQNIEFERCIDFLVRMIDKYGEESPPGVGGRKTRIKEEKRKRQFPEITKCKSDCRFFHVFLNQINFKS